MADAKMEIKVGGLSFSGEGDGGWLSQQLDKVLEKLPQLAKVVPTLEAGTGGESRTHVVPTPGQKAGGTLAAFLKAKGATSNQNRKFLATAIWLHDRDSRERVGTKDVTKALAENHQTRLGNASECLNQNVSKGFCEKVGKDFYVTDDGRQELG